MTFSCLIQQGQISAAMRQELASRLAAIGQEVFGEVPDDTQVGWVEVAPGCGFTAGKPSTSSLAMAVVPDGTSKEDRTRALSAICDAWMEVTGCSVNEIVASAVDANLRGQDT